MAEKYVWNLEEVVKSNPIKSNQRLTRTTLANGKYGTANVVQAQPQTEPFLHIHKDHDEFIYVIEGEGWAYVGDNKFPVKPGDFVYGPAGIEHGFHMPVTGIRLSMYAPTFDFNNPDRVVPDGKDLA
jgi:quercetin dioxygenase-like cupin family protein